METARRYSARPIGESRQLIAIETPSAVRPGTGPGAGPYYALRLRRTKLKRAKRSAFETPQTPVYNEGALCARDAAPMGRERDRLGVISDAHATVATCTYAECCGSKKKHEKQRNYILLKR